MRKCFYKSYLKTETWKCLKNHVFRYFSLNLKLTQNLQFFLNAFHFSKKNPDLKKIFLENFIENSPLVSIQIQNLTKRKESVENELAQLKAPKLELTNGDQAHYQQLKQENSELKDKIAKFEAHDDEIDALLDD